MTPTEAVWIAFTPLMLLVLCCLALNIATEKEARQTHNGVLQNRKHIAELSGQLHKMRERQLIDSKKISLINEFCIEYSWRLVHFSDDELMGMAIEESERQAKLEDDSFDAQP